MGVIHRSVPRDLSRRSKPVGNHGEATKKQPDQQKPSPAPCGPPCNGHPGSQLSPSFPTAPVGSAGERATGSAHALPTPATPGSQGRQGRKAPPVGTGDSDLDHYALSRSGLNCRLKRVEPSCSVRLREMCFCNWALRLARSTDAGPVSRGSTRVRCHRLESFPAEHPPLSAVRECSVARRPESSFTPQPGGSTPFRWRSAPPRVCPTRPSKHPSFPAQRQTVSRLCLSLCGSAC